MQRRRSRQMAAIGMICVFGLVAAGIIVLAQTAAGQEEPKAPVAPGAEREAAPPAEGALVPEGDRRRDLAARGEEARQRFEQERAGRFAAEATLRQPPAIAVAEGKVFVVMNGMLYKFDAETLALEGQQRIPFPRPDAQLLERTGRQPGELLQPRQRDQAGQRPRGQG